MKYDIEMKTLTVNDIVYSIPRYVTENVKDQSNNIKKKYDLLNESVDKMGFNETGLRFATTLQLSVFLTDVRDACLNCPIKYLSNYMSYIEHGVISLLEQLDKCKYGKFVNIPHWVLEYSEETQNYFDNLDYYLDFKYNLATLGSEYDGVLVFGKTKL